MIRMYKHKYMNTTIKNQGIFRCYATNACKLFYYTKICHDDDSFHSYIDLGSLYFHGVQELTQIEKTFISSVLPIMGMI